MLADLYKQSVQEYTKTPAEWMGLLSCVARFYKRSFDNAVLIYAQKPDATQLATFDEWHDPRIDRNINKGTKGIAVIDMANPNASLKHLFDFMDTNGSPQSFRNVAGFLWELEPQYQPSLMVKLHEKYHTPTASIEQCLYKLAQRMVRSRLPAYLEHFKVAEESSPLYGMPIEAVKAEIIELVTDSVAYTVFRKCGIDTAPIEDGAFENISRYNSLEHFMAIGSCTVSLSRPILKEIQQEIKAIKNERSQIYENRTLTEIELHAGRGRNDVSRTPDFKEQTDRQDAGGQIRETVEAVHDGGTPASPVPAGGRGQNQRDAASGGRGSGNRQGTENPAAPQGPADAEERGHAEKSRPHEPVDHDSRGTGHSGNRPQSPLKQDNINHAEPSTDSKLPSVDGFFAVPPKATKEPESTDVPEQPEPAGLPQGENADADWQADYPPLDEEELSDLVDVVLCASDLSPYTEEWQAEILAFWNGGHKQSTKSNVLKAFYRNLDTDYATATGDHIHIQADDAGMTLLVGKQEIACSYAELTDRIDWLIVMGAYPHSVADVQLDDYAIPDEVGEMNGVDEPEQTDSGKALSKPGLQRKEDIINHILSGNVFSVK